MNLNEINFTNAQHAALENLIASSGMPELTKGDYRTLAAAAKKVAKAVDSTSALSPNQSDSIINIADGGTFADGRNARSFRNGMQIVLGLAAVSA